MGISLHWGPLGNLEGGSFTRYFERWMKRALGVKRLSLRELCEGNLEEGLHQWGPLMICSNGSGDGHFFQ